MNGEFSPPARPSKGKRASVREHPALKAVADSATNKWPAISANNGNPSLDGSDEAKQQTCSGAMLLWTGNPRRRASPLAGLYKIDEPYIPPTPSTKERV